MSELVEKLSAGEHALEISIRPDRTPVALKECLDRGYFHVKFTQTRGGTDLYVPLDRDHTDLSGGDFTAGSGVVKLAGKITLDYVPVRCVASIELASMRGLGHLEKIQN